MNPKINQPPHFSSAPCRTIGTAFTPEDRRNQDSRRKVFGTGRSFVCAVGGMKELLKIHSLTLATTKREAEEFPPAEFVADSSAPIPLPISSVCRKLCSNNKGFGDSNTAGTENVTRL
jgi:hypothetical protein